MSKLGLRVLIVAGRDLDARFAARVLEDHGDRTSIALDVPDALSVLSRERHDLALVSLSLPRGDGLALVHHLRALHPDIEVVVMASRNEVEEAAHAMALGVLGSVSVPLTGDAILVAADRARERRLLMSERARLATMESVGTRRRSTYARCAAFVAETDIQAVASLILEACIAEWGCRSAGIYLLDLWGSPRFVCLASAGSEEELSRTLSAEAVAALDPTRTLHIERERVRVLLLGESEVAGVIDMVGSMPVELDQEVREGLEIVAALGTAALTAARKAEAIARAGIKDPETSAYTFAYFGDVAGREIDRASRHGRKFALLTLSFEGLEQLRSEASPEEVLALRRAIADAMLDSVRDSDVLARVEDDEFYLLLPETGLLGALSCRRRMLRRLVSVPELRAAATEAPIDPSVGIAVYPTDGRDLGRLLRASRRRSERSRRGVWKRLGLSDTSFWQSIDLLLGGDELGAFAPGTPGLLTPSEDGDAYMAGHALMSPALVTKVASTLATDAVRHRVPGTLYAAGSSAVAESIVRSVQSASDSLLHAWVLSRPSGPAGLTSVSARLRLCVDDPRLDTRVLLLILTELGGYLLVARPADSGNMLVYHASDLDVVDGLMNALQSTYHLQPEVR